MFSEVEQVVQVERILQCLDAVGIGLTLLSAMTDRVVRVILLSSVPSVPR